MNSEIKEFLTIEEQIELLKSRGLKFSNELSAAQFLKKENYYNIINAYKSMFLETSNSCEQFIDNTHFNEICELYKFDRSLRNIFLKYILIIENNIKSVLAYEFSKNYGHDNYLKIDSFDISVRTEQKNIRKSDKIASVLETITYLQKEISNQLKKKNPMITHYILKYGYVPFWVLVNTLPIGTISKFFYRLKDKDQNNIGKEFMLKSPEMIAVLKILTIFRNACAHDERLYNLKTSVKLLDCHIHEKLNIPKNDGNQFDNGKNDLFSLLIICKLILPKDSFFNLFEELKNAISILSKNIKSIQTELIIKEMGFPANWQDIISI